MALSALPNSFDHIFNDLLSITKDHHGLVHVEQFIIKTGIKIKGLEQNKKYVDQTLFG
jgi:hypothetical protein